MLDLPGLIDTYGYWAVAVGTFLEGETVLALAGFAAFRGYMDFYTVVAIATICGFAGDQFFFFLGRWRGARILKRFPNVEARAHQFDEMLSKWHAPLIVCIRFMYGFRILGPILLGMGRVSAIKFVIFNFIGAAIWAPLIAGLGYLFGNMLEAVLTDVKRIELFVFAGVIVVGTVLLALHFYRARRAKPDR